MIHITECPRDAMQGIKQQIPARLKAEYLNQLLRSGFDVIDFGSFVSPAAIPQMRDTAEVLEQLDLTSGNSRLLAIVANERGARDACAFDEITYLGFPFSISETFQQRNTRSGIEASLKTVEEIQKLCLAHNKELLVYVSMAFGNPYGDPWSAEIACEWTRKLARNGIRHLALADTVGSSTPDTIRQLFSTLLPAMPDVHLGAHLHSTKEKAGEKIKAAFEAGCRRFDVAIRGFGGCPMAREELTGNIATEELVAYIRQNSLENSLKEKELAEAVRFSGKIFDVYH